MQLNILNFPKRAIDRICDFVDRTTLQRIYITSSVSFSFFFISQHSAPLSFPDKDEQQSNV